MAKVREYLEALRDQIKTEMGLKNSDIHGGQFNLKEVNNVARNAPCAFIALLDIPEDPTAKTCDSNKHVISPVVFLFTQGKDCDLQMIDLVTRSKEWIKNNTFGRDSARPAKQVSAKNFYAAEIGKNNIACWGINFTTVITN